MTISTDVAIAAFKLDFPTNTDERKDLIKALTPTIVKIQHDALTRSISNAPIRTGKLRESLQVDAVINLDIGTIVFEFGSKLGYAFSEHEQDHQLGPLSMAQPTTDEGGVGKKYFTRVIDRNFNIWSDWLNEAYLKYIDKKLKKVGDSS